MPASRKPGQPRSERLTLNLTQEELEHLQLIAERDGKYAATIARELLFDAIRSKGL